MKLFVLAALCLFAGLSTRAHADDEKLNCKLTIRTYFKADEDGREKAKMDMEMVHATSLPECKLIAKKRELATDAKVERIQVSYGWNP